MADAIHNAAAGIDAPAWDAAAVSPSNAADLPRAPSRGLYVGTAGDVAVVMAGGTTVTFAGVPAGTVLPIRVDRVRATGTTAGTILALY